MLCLFCVDIIRYFGSVEAHTSVSSVMWCISIVVMYFYVHSDSNYATYNRLMYTEWWQMHHIPCRDAIHKAKCHTGRSKTAIPAVSSLSQDQGRPWRRCGRVADSLTGVMADAAECDSCIEHVYDFVRWWWCCCILRLSVTPPVQQALFAAVLFSPLMSFGYENNSTNDCKVFVIIQILLAFYEVSATRNPAYQGFGQHYCGINRRHYPTWWVLLMEPLIHRSLRPATPGGLHLGMRKHLSLEVELRNFYFVSFSWLAFPPLLS